jgi:hypothetical protein
VSRKRKSLLNYRFLAVVLSIAMVFVTLVPIAAMADSPNGGGLTVGQSN